MPCRYHWPVCGSQTVDDNRPFCSTVGQKAAMCRSYGGRYSCMCTCDRVLCILDRHTCFEVMPHICRASALHKQLLTYCMSSNCIAEPDAMHLCLHCTGQGYIWMSHRNPHSPAWHLAARSKAMWEQLVRSSPQLATAMEWQVCAMLSAAAHHSVWLQSVTSYAFPFLSMSSAKCSVVAVW